MKLNERLKQLRIEKGLSQKDLAQKIEISDRNYQRYEYGEREPVASVLVTLANFYNISLDYLVGRSDDPTRH